MAATRLIASLALSAGLALGQAAPPDDAEVHFRAGDQMEKSGNLAGAEIEYKKSVELQPKNSSALGALAYLYSTQKRYPEAEAALRQFIAIDPQNAKAHLQLGTVLLDSNQNDAAIKELSAASGLAGSDAALLRKAAELYVTHSLYPQAAQQYSTALRLDPKDADAHYGFGVVLMQLRKFDEAQSELQRAVTLRPDNKEAYGDLAVAAAENKDFAGAIQALDARSRFLPESAATYFLRATSYDHLKQMPLAAENYKKFLATDGGKNPNQEWQARHRLVAIERK
jgi:tetratricopeptide (TPR) repeat protein